MIQVKGDEAMNMKVHYVLHGRRMGKSATGRQKVADFLEANPGSRATIVVDKDGETKVEVKKDEE